MGLLVKICSDIHKKKRSKSFDLLLKEAATYSPTGKPQYHRR